jgi:hypothetical protein
MAVVYVPIVNQFARYSVGYTAKMSNDLEELEMLINVSDWLEANELEPCIGDPSCPEIAEEHGTRGKSLYTAFIDSKDDGSYGCKFERCFAYSTRSLDEAIRHMRYHHFNHSPYACVPPVGIEWYVSYCPLPPPLSCLWLMVNLALHV